MEEKLKFCPFCGGEAETISVINDDVDGNVISRLHMVRCLNCNVTTKQFFTKKDAINSWNKREGNCKTAKMTEQKAIKIIQNEIDCVRRANTCGRDCAKCELVLPDVEIIDALDKAIESLRREGEMEMEVNNGSENPDKR